MKNHKLLYRFSSTTKSYFVLEKSRADEVPGLIPPINVTSIVTFIYGLGAFISTFVGVLTISKPIHILNRNTQINMWLTTGDTRQLSIRLVTKDSFSNGYSTPFCVCDLHREQKFDRCKNSCFLAWCFITELIHFYNITP